MNRAGMWPHCKWVGPLFSLPSSPHNRFRCSFNPLKKKPDVVFRKVFSNVSYV